MSAGFYTVDLRYAPNSVIGPGFSLTKEEKDTYSYPVNGWTWYESRDAAVAASIDSGLNPQLTEIKRVELLVQEEKLDKVARSLGYDNIYTAISYAINRNSPNYSQAIKLAQYRDEVWTACKVIRDNVLAGRRLPPSDQELLAELPIFVG